MRCLLFSYPITFRSVMKIGFSKSAKVTELMAAQEKTQGELDAAMERWMYLQERYEQIQAAKEGKA